MLKAVIYNRTEGREAFLSQDMAALYETLLYNEVELYTDLFGLYLYVA